MAIWAEAHDLPHLADAAKKIAYVPILDYRWGKHADAFREEGAIKVPVGYARLDDVHFVDPDDHANDVGSVIHFFQREVLGSDGRPNVVGSFVTERRPDDLQSRATSVTDFSGRGLTAYYLDRTRLIPYDYPANPTIQGDWSFGAPKGGGLLGNPSFENPPMPNGGFELGNLDNWSNTGVGGGSLVATNDPGGAAEGSFYGICASVDDAGAGFKYSFSGAYVGREYTITGKIKQASGTGDSYRAGISDASSASHAGAYEEDGYWWRDVSGNGAWQDFTLTFIAAATGFELIIEYSDAGPGSDFYIDAWDASGFGLGLAPWTPHIPAFTEIFETQTSVVFSGDRALKVQSTDFVYTSPYTGAQGWARTGPTQPVQVVPGVKYTGQAWVRQDSGSDQTFLIIFRRTSILGSLGSPGSSFMGSARVVVPSGTWTLLTLTDIADTNEISFEVRWEYQGAFDDSGHQSPVYYVDECSMWAGEPAITIGEAWTRMLVDRLAWLVPTFTATEDSNGDPWDTERSFSMNEGDTWGQIAESFQRLWGYVHRIRYDREDNTYYFDIFNPGYVAFDHSTTDSGSLIVGMNILGGETVTRTPDATSWHIKGDGGIWVEDTDATLETAWGEADMFLEATQVGTTDDLQDVLDHQMEVTLDQMVTFQASMNNQSQVAPLKHFDIFHMISVELGARSSIDRGDRIVTSVVVSGKPGQAPNYQIYVNSDAFASTGAAALAEAVRRLLRRRTPTGPTIAGGGPNDVDKGGAMTIQIASSAATDYSKAKADFEASGSGDGALIQNLLNALITTGGEVHISEGPFYSVINIIVPPGVKLTGKGAESLISAAVAGWGVTGLEGAILMDFDVVNSIGSGARLGSEC